ncbi:class II aldolase/adducin family protein [Phaeobacter gallaeciensis]|uniref:Ribulose-5-phosphate 4-epimerase n=1 Tax=Phaeobacter gallaeciensis TaxID=60890 RepID=A0AAC9ZC09_9RHOB|nr:class II aldolase/adducin family protein [Phaeobacter gallaeciensis]AHD11860.1 Ribulose-5-phosphate 4-epimerase [Phaeobacter gallaeciensis DSM 26640]ATE95123.1 Ribulose-5-phosphate 4-epimerase [Phaeobacter gallaeciensis]ATE99431.1 Ribulose-5-phosphate 4-epimerase [Phaeobacter gallaeciensis]ATF03828.1 Ribulose-5-phosphate 4-epimerase [Phaeobacter gallaeciensis]ATF08021.1 Ribulose-5-phosphate 4-epimerase [Phaeobacter gallaeciensis]
MSTDRETKEETKLVEAAISDLVLANRILAREDVIDSFGHVSVRHPLRNDRYFLSRSRSPVNVTREDIMEFTLDGELVGEDHRRPYNERHIHGAIYKDRPDVNSVAHHHARSIIPFTMNDISLRPIFHMSSVIGKEVPTWDSQDEFGDTNMLVDSMEMGHSLSRALEQNSVALLRGHGCICVAANVRAVCMVATGLKDNAALVQQSLPLGPLTPLTDGEIEKTSAMLLGDMPLARAWDYWVSRAGYPGL